MMGDNYLLARLRVTPFLMAPGSSSRQKAVAAKNSDHLV
jgi:hypothetical protein